MSDPIGDLSRLAAEYQQVLPYADFWQKRLDGQLRKVVLETNVVLAFPIESRIKHWSSLRDKLVRQKPKSIEEVQDLLGFRIVTLFRSDALAISDALKCDPLFRIIRTYNTFDRLEVDRFGYTSLHIVVELPFAEDQSQARLPLRAEIQVRSVAQHLWAAASHTLQYKHEADVPPPVRRTVYRLAALLETADLELERVLEERRHYTDTLHDRHDDVLNVDLLKATLDITWPSEHRIRDEPYAMLLNSLHREGLRTPRELTSALGPYRARTLAIARKEAERLVFLADRYGVKDGKISYSSAPNRHESIQISDEILARARAGVFYSHTGLSWTALGLAAGTHSSLEERGSV